MGQREAARAHRAVPTASLFSSSHRHSIAFFEFPETSLAMRALRSDPCRDCGNHRQRSIIMTIATTENREPAQATAPAAGKPKPPQKATVAAKKGRAAASQARSARKPRSANRGAQPRLKAGNARPATKTATILDLVKRPGGATLQELLKATYWQPHSIRGFLSLLGKKKGLAVQSTKSPDGERTDSVNA